MYTIEDHRIDPRKYPIHGACGQVWKQRGDITGHCSACHVTYEGVKVFDQHQRQGEDGRTICLIPEDVRIGGKKLHLDDGAWRGPGMTQEALRRMRAAQSDSSPTGD